MPNRVNLRKALSRQRFKKLPPNRTRIQDLNEVPDRYKHSLGGANFLLYDSLNDDDDEERILVFCTDDNIRQLFRSKIWFALEHLARHHTFFINSLY